MEAGRHSITAVMVAAVRARHSAGPEPRIFDDPYAHLLLIPAESDALENAYVEMLQQLNPELAASCSSRSSLIDEGMRTAAAPPIVLARARYVEDALLAALNRGVGQYVIIGAGLDTFAFRRPDLRDSLQVIEIDHPTTQVLKQERLASAGLTPPPNLHFTPADLEQESVLGALGRTGYNRKTPGFFAWPGVTMYLNREVFFRTLRSIASVAASRSELVFDYFDADAFKPGAAKRVQLLMQRTRRVGEPMASGFEPATLGSELSTVGHRLIEDLGPPDIQARFFIGVDGFHATEHWHLVRTVIE